MIRRSAAKTAPRKSYVSLRGAISFDLIFRRVTQAQLRAAGV